MVTSKIADPQAQELSSVTKLFDKLQNIPMGKKLFSQAVCFKAPYFKSINPLIAELKPGYCEVIVKNKRAVQNHLGTVHAIAMANMCELAMGMAVEAACPKDLRWIPRAMEIEYRKKAKTDLKAVCELDEIRLALNTPETAINFDLSTTSGSTNLKREIAPEVNIYDTDGDVVTWATIHVKLSPK